MEAVECGAASLAMVLASHGAWIPLEQLRVDCAVTRDGTNASNLLKAARRYGMSARGFKKEPEKLCSLPLPAIIHWNFNHFLVFEGFKKDKAFLNDPASGSRVVSLEEFNECFTGVALAFEPTEDFKRQGRAPSAVADLVGLLSGSYRALAFIVLASLALVVPGIAIAGFSKIFVDNILVSGSTNWLVPLVLGLLVAAFFRGALTWLQQKYLLRLETRLSLTMASRFMWKLAHLPTDFFTQRHVGDLSDRMAGNDRVANLISGQLATSSMNLLAVIFYGIAIACFNVSMAIIALGLALLNVVALKAVDKRREHSSRMMLLSGGKLVGMTVASIRSAETIKAGGMENDTFAKWSGYQGRLLSAQRRLSVSTALLTAFPALMSSLTTAAILGLGGLRVMEGALSVGALVAIQSLMSSFTGPIASLVNLGGQFQRIKGDLARLNDVRAYASMPPRGPPAGEAWQGPPVLNGRLAIRNVSYGYSPLALPLLNGISLDVEPGARIAIVGGSGSGKSTLGRMLVGIIRPWEGEISIDGHLVDDIPPEVFAASTAYVDQDIFLFDGTVRENLTLWNESIPESVLTRALKDALIYDDVMSREGRYDSHVEEGGINFSGGQRQRLEIARALVADPTLLVLDEATAALDPTTEKQIDDNLRRRGCACVIIAHRLSTIRDSDEIIVLDRGQIVERGTHDALIARQGAYARLIGVEG